MGAADQLRDFVNNLHKAILPTNSHIELELRMLIDSRKRYPVHTHTKNAETFAKHLISKYKSNACTIEPSINLIAHNSIETRRYDNAGTKLKSEFYTKTPLLEPVFMTSDNAPSYKLSINVETAIQSINSASVTYARVKLRYSINMDPWRLDITLVRSVDAPLTNMAALVDSKSQLLTPVTVDNFAQAAQWSRAEYVEFELEYIGDLKTLDFASLTVVDDIFADPHATDQYQDIIYEVAKIIKPKYAAKFRKEYGIKQLSNQVIELNKGTFIAELLPSITNYFITDKVDGKRSIIYATVTPSGKSTMSYSVSDSFAELDMAAESTYVFDAEEYNGTYYIFDVLVWQNTILTNEPFAKRMTYFERAAAMSKLFAIKPFVRLTNDYVAQIEQFKAAPKPYEVDGIIFTPADGRYESMQVYKFKPIEKLSIDFLIKKCPAHLLGVRPYIEKPGKTLYFLFCGVSRRVFTRLNLQAQLVKWYQDVFPELDLRNLPDYFPIMFQPSNDMYAYLHWDERPDLADNVGEFVLRPEAKKYTFIDDIYTSVVDGRDSIWSLLKLRDDRKIEVQRGNYFGNNVRIAEFTWWSHFNPLVIGAELKPYFRENDSQLHKQSRAYNSYVKSRIFEEFNGADWVMDIASGKGQDLFRYGKASVHNLVCLEIDYDAISELVKRKYEFAESQNSRMFISVCQIDMMDAYTKNINRLKFMRMPNDFPVIVCNFAFHYFLQSEQSAANVVKFINNYARIGTRFIFTAFDGAAVMALLNDNRGNWTVYDKSDKDRPQYSIRSNYEVDTLQQFGQQIELMLPFSVMDYYKEYLVNIEAIAEVFEKYGFVLELNKSFIDYGGELPLSANDKIYVGLYHAYCFVKTGKGGASRRSRK